MNNNKIRVAITHGSTNGIGYELIFKAFEETDMFEYIWLSQSGRLS